MNTDVGKTLAEELARGSYHHGAKRLLESRQLMGPLNGRPNRGHGHALGGLQQWPGVSCPSQQGGSWSPRRGHRKITELLTLAAVTGVSVDCRGDVKDPQRATVTPEEAPATMTARIWHIPIPYPGAILERIKSGRIQWKE